jgi:hypothetical protein
MLHLFRFIRKDLIQVNNVKKYILYAFGEILLIVVGILIAVQIGEWNQERRDRIEEIMILQAIGKELEEGLEVIEVSLAEVNYKDTALKQLAVAFKDQAVEDDQAFLADIAAASAYAWGLPRLPNFTFEEQVNSGKLGLIKDEQLRRRIYEFYQVVREQEERAVLRKNLFGEVAYEFVPRAENYVIDGVLETGDYQVLQGLNENEYAELTTSVLNSELKRHIIPEQNRGKFLRGLWLYLEIQTTDLLAEIEAELERK